MKPIAYCSMNSVANTRVVGASVQSGGVNPDAIIAVLMTSQFNISQFATPFPLLHSTALPLASTLTLCNRRAIMMALLVRDSITKWRRCRLETRKKRLRRLSSCQCINGLVYRLVVIFMDWCCRSFDIAEY